MTTSPDLLKELRIDRRPGVGRPRRRKWPWFLGVAAVLVVAIAAIGMNRPAVVETVPARDAADPANASVLDASGYIVARR
ncbi:MAG: efflux RND transporter periplasmic adaptor subunit, partial [Pseudomonadota bacterium]|nr:efflux RND transporter periplasmic adaptor subunit [Pseudomonadota bacterium]